MDNYLFEDDLIIKSEIIISIFKNINKINDQEFLFHFDAILTKYLDTNFSSDSLFFRNKVFFSLIEEISKKMINEKDYALMIKNFIKKFIMNNDVFYQSKENYLFIKSTKIYPQIFFYLEEIDLIFKLQNDQNFSIDFILFLVRVVFEINIPIQTQSSTGTSNSITINSTSNTNTKNSAKNLVNLSNSNKENSSSQNLGKFFIKLSFD